MAQARILRKADGTGFFIFIIAPTVVGSRLADGQYRLHFRYRRDNTSNDPNSLILTESGRDDDELVQLVIPEPS